jgi:acetyl-CoA acyltransferase
MTETPSADRSDALTPAPEASALDEIRHRADTVWTRGPNQAPMIAGKAKKRQLKGPEGRVAIVDACRTPFTRSSSDFVEMDVVDLAGVAAAELVARNDLGRADLDMSIFGVVVPALNAPNLGREVIFRTSLPMGIPGTTVNLACASSNRALTSGAEAILIGQASAVLTGGAESLSNVPIQYSRNAAHALIDFTKARSMPQKLSILGRVRPKDLIPVPPAIAEYTTGMTMGEACEKMAKENGISRRAQDEVALMSHQRAAAAWQEGRFDGQVVTTFPPPKYKKPVAIDNGVRSDSSMEALGKLKPVFDRRFGTLTAGNSSPLTDGGAAVLLMSEERAKALGYTPLGFVRSWAYAAVDPGAQLLQGPAYAAPLALERAGVSLADMDLVEMHEAFAAQLVSNAKALASKKFAEEELGRSAPVGEIDFDKVNVNGGSIAIGHPFGATGARVTMQLLYELRRRGANLGLMTVCAAGGVGFAMVVERE